MSSVIFTGTVQLLGWSDTHNSGPKLVLQLESSEDLEAFKHLTVKHGKTAGQILGIAVTLLDPATGLQPGVENPLAEKPKGGPLSRLAGMWCHNEEFSAWLMMAEQDFWSSACEAIPGGSSPEISKRVLYDLLMITSLAELDHIETAAQLFNSRIRLPFMSRG